MVINWAAIILRVQGNKYGALIDFSTSCKGHQLMALMQALTVKEQDITTIKSHLKNKNHKNKLKIAIINKIFQLKYYPKICNANSTDF
ncbi:hypothetical protein [Photobacterium kishitanii]|uniref:hypothetical protein n=1 Tax=Photobacterium kishitanii TaxID=318456 RepID=UPI00273970B5|nr:hypothetical protein [Photobacterium kishitanii]